MAIIYSYPQFAPKPEDLLIGTVTLDENAVVPIYDNPTVSFTIQSLLDMIAPITGAQNLQQVTNIGATTTNAITFSSDISVTGRFYDSSGGAGTAGQVLSSTVTGTSWIVNSPASVTSVGLSMPAAFSVANSPITTAGILTVTGAGSALQYINGLGNLVTFPTIPTQYVLPLAANGTRGGIQIGYSSAGKNYAVQLSSEKAFVNVPWTDTPYTLPVATSSDLGGVKIGYTDNAKNYAVELDSDQMYVNVPWTDTTYTLPLAADGTRGGVQIGYTQAATRDYPVTLDSEKMLVTVPWTDTQNPNQTLLGTGSDNSDSGIILNESGGTVLILGDGSVTAAQTSNTITLTGVNTWVANAVTVAGYVAAPAATDVNLVWKTNGSGEPAWRADADTDTGITGVTLAINSTGTWTVPLSESITGRELTLTSNVYGGGAKVGFVPTGGTSSLYLKGDGTWAAVPTGLQFKGTWDASGGGGGSPDLTQAVNQGDGFLWITSVAGTAYPNGGAAAPSTWNLGDWAVYVGAAGSGTWTRVPATNAGVTSVTTTDGSYIDLTPDAASTGAVTVTADLSAQDGSSDTSTKFLSKDNTWDVPSYTTNTDETYDLNAGAKVGTSVPINLTSTSGTDNSLVNLKEGTNITLTRGSATEITIDATDTNTNTTYDFLAIETIPTFTLNTPTTNTGYTTAVNLATTVSPAGGTGMTVDITASSGNVTAVVINKPGSGYAVGDAVTVVQTGSSANAIITLSGATGNVNPNLRLIDNAFAFEDVKLTGAGATTITRTSDTGITITSTDTNTQYTAGNGLNLSGTAFSADVNNTQANSATTALSATAGRFYAVQLDNNGTIANANLVVNVPWTDNNTEYLAMTTSTLGLGKIRYDVGSTPAAESQSTTASRTYGITKNASNQLVVNVPWVSGGSYNWKVRDNAGTPVNKTLSSGEFLQFKTATGALATGLTGSGTTSSPYIMTLTSPNTTYSVMGAGNSYAAGLVTAGSATHNMKFLRRDGSWDTPTNTTYSDFVSSTAGAVGTAGLVPAPAAATQGGTYYLNGDKSFSVPPGTYSLPLAASGTRGGVQIGYTESGKNYPVELSSEKMFVNVPWTDTITNTTYSIDVPSATTNINLKGANPSSNDAIALTPSTGISIIRSSDSQLTFSQAASINVTVASSGGSNKYFLDGILQADAILKPSFVYRFDQSNATNSSHPLRFSSDSANATPYTTGVTAVGTPGSAGAYTQIITTQATPYLYYYCTSHSGMGGDVPLQVNKITSGQGITVSPSTGDGNVILSVARATNGANGGLRIGYTAIGTRDYALLLDSNGEGYVNVPWTDGGEGVTAVTGALPITSTEGTTPEIAINTMGAAAAATAGLKGAVPPSAAGDQLKFLRADATWVIPDNDQLGVATTTVLGGIELGSATVLNTAYVTGTAGSTTRSYPVQLNAARQAAVYVPWTDSGDTGITGVTLDTGTSTGAPLTESIASRELTLTSMVYAGAANVGYVPAGGTNVKFLRGDATWQVPPTGPNDNDYLTGLAFNTTTGVLTATVQNQSDVTVDLDGRYLTSVPLASDTVRGGMKIGFTESGKNYPVELSSEKAYVNVPWTDNNTTYSAGNGINFSGTPATQINADINYISYSGNNNFIIYGTQNDQGTTIPTGSQIAYANPSGTQIVSRGLVSDLPFSNNSGTVTGTGTSGVVAKWNTVGTGLIDSGLSFPPSTTYASFVLGASGGTTVQFVGNASQVGDFSIKNTTGAIILQPNNVAIASRVASFSTTDIRLNESTIVSGTYLQTVDNTATPLGNLYVGSKITTGDTLNGFRINSVSGGLYFDVRNTGDQIIYRDYDGASINDRFKMDMSAGTFTASGDLIAYGSPSDKRLKENIKPIESALDKVMKLQGVTFDWKQNDNILSIKQDIGFIAQDVKEVIPELVRENEDGMLSMRHQGIAPILLEAIKELKAEIEELKCKSCNCK